MKQENTHPSVILLLDGNPPADNKFIKHWFKKSRFTTCECTDIFDGLEEISDFTTWRRPDVILFEVESMSDGFQEAKNILRAFSEESDTPILAFSGGGKDLDGCECFDGSLAKLEAKLNSLIPVYKEARRTIAA